MKPSANMSITHELPAPVSVIGVPVHPWTMRQTVNAIEQAIDDLQAELATLKTALNAREATALETFFAKGQEFRQQWVTGLEDGERK